MDSDCCTSWWPFSSSALTETRNVSQSRPSQHILRSKTVEGIWGKPDEVKLITKARVKDLIINH